MFVWIDYVTRNAQNVLSPYPLHPIAPLVNCYTMLPRRSSHLILSLAVAIALSAGALAHGASNGMDMSMDGAMDLTMGSMTMWMHFTPGDTVLFYGWVPTSAGAMVGTCIGLFLLALVDRWIAASRAVMEAYWSKRSVRPHFCTFFQPCVPYPHAMDALIRS